jgi:F-type H+-transporting ATPase subunit delta
VKEGASAVPRSIEPNVTNRTAATRYARALLDVSVKEQADLSQIEAQLTEFRDLITQHELLAKVLLNPAVPAPRKRALIAELVSRAGLQPVVGRMLVLLAERDRLVIVPDMIAAFRERLQELQHVVRAEVTTAMPLAAERAQQLEQSIAAATGRTVRLSTRVDPAIIGGLVARVGSTVYDGSVTNHLQRMKQRLEESV